MRLRKLVQGLACVVFLLVAASCAEPQPLPVLAQVPEFSLRDQAGRAVTRETFRGKVWVADFIFSSCPDVCPLLTERLSGVRKALIAGAGAERLAFVSFSVDPEHDTPARLAAFAKQHGALVADWWFLTGPVDDVKHVVTAGFKQAMEAQPAEPGRPRNVLHGTHFVLVDRNGAIRGFFASDEAGIAELELATARLLAER